MRVTVHIPGRLREFTAGRMTGEIEPSPTTLADALSALCTLCPGVRDRIVTEQGQVREHMNIFIGNENIRYPGIQVDSRVLSPPDLKFRSSPPLAVGERFPVVCSSVQ